MEAASGEGTWERLLRTLPAACYTKTAGAEPGDETAALPHMCHTGDDLRVTSMVLDSTNSPKTSAGRPECQPSLYSQRDSIRERRQLARSNKNKNVEGTFARLGEKFL